MNIELITWQTCFTNLLSEQLQSLPGFHLLTKQTVKVGAEEPLQLWDSP